MPEFIDSDPATRASRYLLLAEIARHRAEHSPDPNVKHNYEIIAEEYEELAARLHGDSDTAHDSSMRARVRRQ